MVIFVKEHTWLNLYDKNVSIINELLSKNGGKKTRRHKNKRNIIEKDVFYECPSLKKVVIPQGVHVIE